MSTTKRKAVFLDRDNTLIEDPGYISHPSQVKLLPGTAASLIQLRKMDFLIIVISNQSGIARGILTEEMLAQIHHQLEKLLADEGAYLDAIYYCPYHPDGVISKYRMESELRKPAPGMILKAAQELNVDLSQSWTIGDSYRDIEAGKRAGCKTILINNPVKPATKNPSDPTPDRQAVNIREAVNIIRMYELKQNVETSLEHPHRKPSQTPTVSSAAAEVPVPIACQPSVPKTPEISTPDLTASETTKDRMRPAESAPATLPADKPVEVNLETASNISDVSPVKEIVPESPKEPQQKNAEQKISADAVKPIPSSTAEAPRLSSKTEQLLAELLSQMKSAHRAGQYEDFTLSKVAAGAAQFLAIACLVVSLWPMIDPTCGDNWILIMLGYATVLQLMAIAFYMMRDR